MSHEKELDRIRREPANKICPNCQKEDKLGFDAVCWPFKSFVCSTCKSSHQAFSHRCKSVRMSNWTRDEVEQLKSENGGGNLVCQATWLGNLEARGGRRPKQGDEEKIFKQFVDQAYNHRSFYKEGGTVSRQQSAGPSGSGGYVAPSVSRFHSAYPDASVQGPGAPDLLGAFSDPPPASAAPQGAGDELFGAFGGATPAAPAPSASGGFGDFGAFASGGDDFGAFTSGPPSKPSSVAPPASGFGDFGDFQSVASAATAPGAFGAISPPPPGPGPSPGGGGDLFASMSAPAMPVAASPSPGLAPQPAASGSPAASKANIMAAFNTGGPAAPTAAKPPAAILDPADFGGSRSMAPPGRMPSGGMGPMGPPMGGGMMGGPPMGGGMMGGGMMGGPMGGAMGGGMMGGGMMGGGMMGRPMGGPMSGPMAGGMMGGGMGSGMMGGPMGGGMGGGMMGGGQMGGGMMGGNGIMSPQGGMAMSANNTGFGQMGQQSKSFF